LADWFLVGIILTAIVAVIVLIFGVVYSILCLGFVAGAMTGVVSRDIAYSWRIVRRWPLLSSVLNWEKIGQLMDGSEDA
jgi:hypothetical protein